MILIYLITVICLGTAILSTAEMASVAPTSGGQYHWVSEFAPRNAQKFLSFMTGWLCVLGWQTGVAGGGYVVANQIQGLLILNDSSYVFERWHGNLLTIAVALFAIVFNTFLAKKLPLIEGIILVLHVFGFFGILIPLWVFAPLTPAPVVFTQFSDNGGWGSMGLATLVGMTSPVYALLGPDSAVHMDKHRAKKIHDKNSGLCSPRNSRRNQGRLTGPAFGNDMDIIPKRHDRLHHAYNSMLLRWKRRRDSLDRNRLPLHRSLLQRHEFSYRDDYHDHDYYYYGRLQHNQQCGYRLSSNVRLCT